jgi:adenylosuccinate lyase
MVSQWNEEVSDVLNSVVSWVPRATMDWWKKWYMMADSAGFAFYIVDVFINVIIRGLAMLKVDQSADKEVVEKYEVQMILKHWYDAVALCDITEDVAKRHWSMKKKGKDLERDKDCIDKWLLIR